MRMTFTITVFKTYGRYSIFLLWFEHIKNVLKYKSIKNKPVELQWTALREVLNEIGESPRICTSCKF